MCTFLLVSGLGLTQNRMKARAASGSSSVAFSSSNPKIGETLTVTLQVKTDTYAMSEFTMQYDSSILEFTGSSNSSNCSGGNGLLKIMFDGLSGGGTEELRITFNTIATGSSKISVSFVEAYNVEGKELIPVPISGCSATVTVQNAAAEPSGGGTGESGGNTDGNDGGETATKSSDNSLRSLTISPGSLSPAFASGTTNYTATVASDVEGIAVDAKVSNEKASVESVTGNTKLAVGANTVRIKVKAENGTVATYTIVVTRAAETKPAESDSNTTKEKEIVVDGVNYKVSATLPEDTLPAEFTKETATYNGQTVEVYAFPYENLKLYYLNPTDSTSSSSEFCFYNEKEETFFPYINIIVGTVYVIYLPDTYSTQDAPAGYEKTELLIGNHLVSAYQLAAGDADASETTEKTGKATADQTEKSGDGQNDFYLVYAVNQNGEAGWYQYDASNMSMQRFNTAAYENSEYGAAADYVSRYNMLLDTSNAEKKRSRLVMAALIVGLFIALAVIVDLLLFYRRNDKDDQGEGENPTDQDMREDPAVRRKIRKAHRKKKKERRSYDYDDL